MIYKEEDFSKPLVEINFDNKKRGKRRRGDVPEGEPKPRQEPYKRPANNNYLLEDDDD